MEGKLDSVNGLLIGDLETSSALIFSRQGANESAKINGVSLEQLHSIIQAFEIGLAPKEDYLGQGTNAHYLNEEKNFVTLNSDDVEESIGGGQFLTDERVINSVLDEYDTAATSDDTGGVLADEKLISAIKKISISSNRLYNRFNFW